VTCALVPKRARVNRVGLGDWNRAATEYEKLDDRMARLQREIELGNRLAHQLITGTITLTYAIEQMEPHLRARPEFEIACETYYRVPGNTRLGTARYLILKVRGLLDAEPYQLSIVSARLEAEYEALK
jgi:hypothetical protein